MTREEAIDKLRRDDAILSDEAEKTYDDKLLLPEIALAIKSLEAWDKVKADITSMDRMAHGQTKRIISDIKAIVNKRLREVEE